jgi:hypothetical protein
MIVDQSSGAGMTFSLLGGTLNGVNTTFTVSQAVYISGSLRVYLNGQLLVQGSDADWVELSPAAGTFTMNVAPDATDIITAEYGFLATTAVGPIGPTGPTGPQGPNNVMHSQIVFTVEGLYLGAIWQGVKPMRIRVPYVGAGATIEKITTELGTAVGVTAMRIAILNNGSNILTGTTYIETPVGQTYVTRTTNITTALALDDYLQWQLVQGDAQAADLVIRILYKWTMTSV